MGALVKRLSTSELDCLRDGKRLNDLVINKWLELLGSRNRHTIFCGRPTRITNYDIALINSNFFKSCSGRTFPKWSMVPLVRWCKYCIIPIHDEGREHWYLAILHLESSTIYFLDSLGRHLHQETVVGVFTKCLGTQIQSTFLEGSTQTNGSDCSIYLLHAVVSFVRDPREWLNNPAERKLHNSKRFREVIFRELSSLPPAKDVVMGDAGQVRKRKQQQQMVVSTPPGRVEMGGSRKLLDELRSYYVECDESIFSAMKY